MNTPQKWQYSFTEPGKEWYKKGNSGKWISGNGPFGIKQMNTPEVNTIWENSGLYLQKDFNIKAVPNRVSIVTYNTGYTDIYINGEFAVQIYNLKRLDSELKVSEVLLPEKAMKLLKPGINHLSVKFAFNPSDQPFNFFDIGIKEY